MAVKTYTQELEWSASAARMFKAACLDSHNFFPKLMPQTIKSNEFLQGDCLAPGNVKVLKYVSEGDILGDNLECIVVEEKVEVKGAGCVVKMITHFQAKSDAELNDEKLKMGKEKITLTFKAIDEYLQANPEAYA
ncbi:hypothetical protein V2J09_009285 [Rumex salicifolius]